MSLEVQSTRLSRHLGKKNPYKENAPFFYGGSSFSTEVSYQVWKKWQTTAKNHLVQKDLDSIALQIILIIIGKYYSTSSC